MDSDIEHERYKNKVYDLQEEIKETNKKIRIHKEKRYFIYAGILSNETVLNSFFEKINK